jgi:hypothetical protein
MDINRYLRQPINSKDNVGFLPQAISAVIKMEWDHCSVHILCLWDSKLRTCPTAKPALFRRPPSWGNGNILACTPNLHVDRAKHLLGKGRPRKAVGGWSSHGRTSHIQPQNTFPETSMCWSSCFSGIYSPFSILGKSAYCYTQPYFRL